MCQNADTHTHTHTHTHTKPATKKKDPQRASHCVFTGAKIMTVSVSALECLQTSSGQEYKGEWSLTVSGRECQRWDSSEPHVHFYNTSDLFPDDSVYDAHNYCRNPPSPVTGGISTRPWCYTTDNETEWEYCPTFYCGEQSLCFAVFGPVSLVALVLHNGKRPRQCRGLSPSILCYDEQSLCFCVFVPALVCLVLHYGQELGQ